MDTSKNPLIPTFFASSRNLLYGESLYLTGSHPCLGKWCFENSLELTDSNQNIWHIIVFLPEHSQIEYKFIQSKSKKKEPTVLKWDEGFNKTITIEKNSYETDLTVMSFNIRYENKNDGVNSWQLRKNSVSSIILTQMPDLLGIQESKPNQTYYLHEELLKYYDIYARGRDYNDSDEANAIFYNKNRFLALDKGTFWLSEDRYQPGTLFKKAYFPRIVSWVKLFDYYKRQFLWYFNTHFDHLSSSFRRKSSGVLLEEIDKICGFNENILLSGDFNANETEDCIQLIKKRLNDSEKQGLYTFHDFKGADCSFGKIDFIFIGSNFHCKEFITIKTSEKRDGIERFPSDHFPIKALLKYKKI